MIHVEDMHTEWNAHPEDVESTHQLRVAMRELRSLLSFLHPFCPDWLYITTQDTLRSKMQALSSLRDIDVWLESLDQYLYGKTLLNWAEEERMRMLNLVVKEFEKDVDWEYLKDIRNRIITLDLFEMSKATFREYAVKQVTSWKKKGRKALKEMDIKDKKGVHKIRIRYKKIKYVSDAMKEMYGAKKWNQHKMGTTLALLGKLCDTERQFVFLQEFRCQTEESTFKDETEHYEDDLIKNKKKIQKKLKKIVKRI